MDGRDEEMVAQIKARERSSINTRAKSWPISMRDHADIDFLLALVDKQRLEIMRLTQDLKLERKINGNSSKDAYRV
jgi:hypothetical protein